MPTIEFFGFEGQDRATLEAEIRGRLAAEPFRDDIVFVTASPSQVHDWQGRQRPFVRVSSRSPRRAARIAALSNDLCDLETVRIGFQPKPSQAAEGPQRAEGIKDAMEGGDLEPRLIEALQPVRGFALAQGIYHFFASGIHDRLLDGAAAVGDLAEALELDAEVAAGFLRYLANEDLVGLRDGVATLTDRGRGLTVFRPWYELLVGGYAQTLQQIGDVLRGGRYASRDGAMVGSGSCGISQHDALPLVRGLLGKIPPPTRVVDLGCGDGTFLTTLVQGRPGVTAVGVDPCAAAGSVGDEEVRFERATATDYVRGLDAGDRSGTLFLAAFVLQEILEQEGRPAVVSLVHDALAGGAHFAVVEVDHRPTDPTVMRHGLGLAYYNAYYLLHVLTEQRLETEEFWRRVFDDAGADVVARGVVDPAVDSTGLEFGCLLTARR